MALKANIALLNTRLAAVFAGVILAAVFVYWENFRWLYSQWMTDDAYSHGFFVPLISFYLVWSKKEFFFSVSPRPSPFLGYLFVCFCFFLLLIGRVGAVVQLEALSFFLMIPSCVLLLFGWQYLKALFFPIFYLQFMIPWMDPILEKMHAPFQLISATIGTALLALKYPVHSNELFIHLPNISMEVARECSGINFLISVIAVGLPLVYLTQKTWFRAAVVIFIGCILTVLSNGLRIAIAGYFGENYGPELLHGPAHIFQGWFVAWFGWIGLFIVNWLFGKIPYKKGEPKYYLYERWRDNDKNIPSPSSAKGTTLRFHFITLLLLLFGFTSALHLWAMPKTVVLNTPLQEFPVEINGWRGVESNWLGENTFFPNLDASVSRAYRDQSGNVVYLFVGYYQKQDNDKRLISYLSGPLHANSEIVSITEEQSSFQAVSSSRSSKLPNLATLFWYQFPDKLKMVSRMRVKLQVLKSGLLQRRNNGAIILLAAPSNSGKGDGQSRATLQSFAVDLAPVMDTFLP